MLHNNLSTSNIRPMRPVNEGQTRGSGPMLVSGAERRPVPRFSKAALAELALITSRRCSSFFAEAAVLVLVFGILDLFLLKGHIDAGWIIGALAISLALLGASIATDFTAQCWLKAHP